MTEPFLECRNIARAYGDGRLRQEVLSDVCLACHRGEACALIGPSGSGKTTLLSILGGMLSPSSGEVVIGGQAVNYSSPGQLTRFRRDQVGFVFQQARLLPFLTIEDNLRVVGRNAGISGNGLSQRISSLLDRLSIAHLRTKRPKEASGGERQRVAVARALLHRPPLVLADEPTAALDWENGEQVMLMLTELARDENVLLVTVTHDTRLLPMFQRTLAIDSGRVTES